jgi:hypothetical protein
MKILVTLGTHTISDGAIMVVVNKKKENITTGLGGASNKYVWLISHFMRNIFVCMVIRSTVLNWMLSAFENNQYAQQEISKCPSFHI